MKILVTGGMGFIGSNFIRRLLETVPDTEVINFDALTYAGNPENLEDIQDDDRYIFIHGDIAVEEDLEAVFKAHNPEIVINFAAESHVDRSLCDSGDFVRSNILGVELLLKAIRKYQTKRFIQISTDEIYGDIESGYSSELDPIRPSNPYAASKAAADVLVQSYIKCHKVPALIVRGSNNFGPYQYPEKLIPLAITNLLAGEIIPVHGTGKHVRTWLHTDDFADGIIAVMQKAENGSAYNIAGTEKSNLDIIDMIASHLGLNAEDFTTFTNDRLGADFRYAPSGQKIKDELGFEPKKNIDDTLGTVIDWYLNNEEWWKEVRCKREFIDHYERQKHAKYY